MEKIDTTANFRRFKDGYINAVTGLGLAADKSNYGVFRRLAPLKFEELSDLYEQDSIAARVIDRLPDDATREEIELEGVDEEFDFAQVQSRMDDLNGRQTIGDAWRWSRLYGGALLVIVADGSGPMEEPLDLKRVKNVSTLQVVEAQHVIPVLFDAGLGSRAFRNPEFYDIVNIRTGRQKRVHRTRAIRFDGLRVPPTRMVERAGWGPSILDRINTEVSQLGEVMGYSRNIMHMLSILVFKLENFRQMMCGTDKQQAEARDAMQSLVFGIDNINAAFIDTKDEFVEVARTTGGFEALIDKFVDALVRASDMPRAVILGEQAKGLNASSDSELRVWYDFVKSQQNRILTPAMNRLLEVLFAVEKNNRGKAPQEWTIKYKPLWQPDAKDQAETDKKDAETSQIYADLGVKSVDEIRAELISAGKLVPEETPADDISPELPEDLPADTIILEPDPAIPPLDGAQDDDPEDEDGNDR